MANVPNLNPPAPSPKPKAPVAASPPMKWYRVMSADKKIPRPQGDFVLRQGKEINSANFDIARIQNLGVDLKEIDEPGWHKALQGGAPETEAPGAP